MTNQWIEEKVKKIVEDDPIKLWHIDTMEAYLVEILKDAYNKGLDDAVESAPDKLEERANSRIHPIYETMINKQHNTCREQFVNNIRSKKI